MDFQKKRVRFLIKDIYSRITKLSVKSEDFL